MSNSNAQWTQTETNDDLTILTELSILAENLKNIIKPNHDIIRICFLFNTVEFFL